MSVEFGVESGVGGTGTGGTGGLDRTAVLSLIRQNANNFTVGTTFPTTRQIGSLHYISEDNTAVVAEDESGDPIRTAFNGNVFRYSGSAWVFIYNFRSLIEFLIGVYSLYVGEYAGSTAYEANKVVTHNDDIFWTIAAVADTNTTAPASNASFVQLNGGVGGSSTITASQFLAVMPDYLKVISASLEPPYFDPNAVHSRYIANIEVINGSFAATEEIVIYFNGIPVETSTNFDSSTPNTINVDLTPSQRQTLGLALAVAGQHTITVGFEFVDSSNQQIYLHNIEVERVSYPLPLGVDEISFSPPFLNPSDLKDRLTAHVRLLADSFPDATQVRLALNGIIGSAINIDRTGTTHPFTTFEESELASLKRILDTSTELSATLHFLDSNGDGVYISSYSIPKAEIDVPTGTVPSWLNDDDPIPVGDLPNDLRVIDFEFSPPYFDPDEILSTYHAKVTTLADAFSDETHARLRILGINGDRVAIRGIQATPSISFNATQRETLKTYLQTNSSVDVELDYGTVIGGNFAIGHTISYHFIPRVHIKRYIDNLQTELDNLETEVEQLQTHTGQSTLQPTLRLHTPTRGKTMPAVFLEDELFVLESDSNASEGVQQFVPDYRRDTTGTLPTNIDGIVTANLGGRLNQAQGASDSGMFAERRISALVQINDRKIKIVSPATLFDAASITGETTELRLSMPGYQHLVYTLQRSTFESDDAATRTLNGVLYYIYETKEVPEIGVIGAVEQSTDRDGNPAKISVQIVQEVSGVKQFLTGDTAAWATGNTHTAGLYQGDENGLPFEVEIMRKPVDVLAWDDARGYADVVLPEDYAKYKHLDIVVMRTNDEFFYRVPVSALNADRTIGGNNNRRIVFTQSTRTLSRFASGGQNITRFAYVGLN